MAYPGYNSYGGPMQGVPAQGMPMPGMPAGIPPGGGYPGQPYGGFPGSFPAPPVQDPMWGYFTAIAGQDGEVDADELQRCLTQTGISGSYNPFSLETCRIMIAMLDRDYTGKMGFNEFKELFTVLNGWKQNFVMVDRDGSGTVEGHELSQCITNMGYRITPQALNCIIKRYSRSGKIYFDDFVACCVKLRSLTDNFRKRDSMQQGVVNFQYDDFILCTMSV
ncbi:Grancalcin [Triplophysa tibetana]|uniref:Grancalcin n=1 Tax=Triplophysa tibetana TaxID=1572043 RepID=A0A5A9NSW0_9TELE|nr:Grancalcin [Triplophysa tibetana]